MKPNQKLGEVVEGSFKSINNLIHNQMKKIDKLILGQLAKKELSKGQQSLLKGGRGVCPCGCCYGDSGGSDSFDNGTANCERGIGSSGCANGAYTFC